MNALPDLIVGDPVSIVVLHASFEIIRDAALELLDLSVCLPEHKTVRTDKNES
jgi:divalent metal cation (Fe/Co/Zn/Cd) transporter